MTDTSLKDPLVLYHANCLDGFTSAWCAWRKLGDRATYLPVQYGQAPPPEALAGGRDVFVLDFSYPRPFTLLLAAKNRSLTILDHHLSAQKELEGLEEAVMAAPARPPHIVFDLEESGATLAWDYFHGRASRPWLVDYARNRDLWRWKLPESRAVCAALASLPWTFPRWDALYQMTTPGDDLAREGGAILRYQQQQVDRHVAAAVPVMIDGHAVYAVNATVLHSEIGEALAQKGPFGVTWFRRPDGKFVHSLRSRGDFDVSLVAKKYGGGGHRPASGFESFTICPPTPPDPTP